jgi:type I restriction enzyme S subunit
MGEVKENIESWKNVKLGTVCKLKNGYAFKSTYYTKEGIPVIRISDIKNGNIETDKTVRVEDSNEFDGFTVKSGDILLAMSGATTGKFGVYKTNDKAFQNQRVGKFQISNPEILKSDFLLYQLYALKRQIEKDAYGGAQPNISSSKIEEMEIVLPPIPIQQAIVSKIEELFSELDKGIENLRTAQQQLKTYRQSVLKWAFEGKLTEEWRRQNNAGSGVRIPSGSGKKKDDTVPGTRLGTIPKGTVPKVGIELSPLKAQGETESQSSVPRRGIEPQLPEGWEWVRLEDVGDWRGGGTPSKSNLKFWENGKIPWVSPKDMKTKLIHNTEDKITEDAITHSSTKKIPKGSILFVVRSGILRKLLPVAITSLDVTINQDLQALTPYSALPEFLFWQLQNFNEDIREKCSKNGTTVESIESKLLKNYEIILIPLNEQQAIVEEIESRLSVADKMEESITQSLQQAEALRQSILKMAFEGRLV